MQVVQKLTPYPFKTLVKTGGVENTPIRSLMTVMGDHFSIIISQLGSMQEPETLPGNIYLLFMSQAVASLKPVISFNPHLYKVATTAQVL